MSAVQDARPELGVAPACAALDLPRATYYRRLVPRTEPSPRPAPPRALSVVQRREVLEVLHSGRFVDCAPRQVYAALLDDNRYLCSFRTMYRILTDAQEARERRNQRRHPQYKKPELLAEAPNQVWSWDISKLLGPVKWTYFYLYVMLDIFSRYVVGWLLAGQESAALARTLIAESCQRQGVRPGQLTIHADRGSPMKAKTTAMLLADLGVTKSHSRPHVSDDNPYSEAQFKTLKYRPDFPGRFGCIQDARVFCRAFFEWYNGEHYHGGLNLLTPQTVHYGLAERVVESRQRVLNAAFAAHPERFVLRPPRALLPPAQAWINPPPTEKGSNATLQ